MSEPIAVLGVRRAMKEMADGTIRVQIDIRPDYRAAFLRDFGEIDSDVAITRVRIPGIQTPAEATEEGARKTAAAEERHTIGPLCQLACIWCKDPHFQRFVAGEMDKNQHEVDESVAKHWLLDICNVGSRKALDTDPLAKGVFMEVRQRYLEFQDGN